MRGLRGLAAACLVLLLAACAHQPSPPPPDGPRWSGRLSLITRSEPAQSFSAVFDLQGSARAGRIVLTSPLGNTLAQLDWEPDGATLQGGGQSRRFATIEALLDQLAGAPIPVGALFDWLNGRPTEVRGWRPDLSQAARGRLSARRAEPLPEVELRVVLDEPASIAAPAKP